MTDDEDDTWPTADGPVLANVDLSAGRGPTVVAWAAGTEIGRVRTRNEDRWGHLGTHAFVVADGMGGHDGGELAASTAVRVALEGDGGWQDRVIRANEAVRDEARDAGFDNAGTTLVAVAVTPRRATVVGVGDSRVYRLREGRLDQLTEDHTVRGALLAAGIDADQHASPRQARGLTSYLGISPDRLRVDVIDVPTRVGDRLLLCSDGVHQAFDHHGLADELGRRDAEQVVAGLLRGAEAAGGRDNATAIVIDLG